MGRPRKILRYPLPSEWIASLLAAQDHLSGISVGERLSNAQQELQQAIEEARRHLRGNPLMPVVAEAISRQCGHRGVSEVVVDDDGSIMVEIRAKSRKGDKEDAPKTSKRAKPGPLPPIGVLRKEAEDLGVDVSELGRAKKKIISAIEAHKANPGTRPKMTKTAPAIGTPVILNPDSEVKPVKGGNSKGEPFSKSKIPDNLLDEEDSPDKPPSKLQRAVAASADVDLDRILKQDSEQP